MEIVECDTGSILIPCCGDLDRHTYRYLEGTPSTLTIVDVAAPAVEASMLGPKRY